MVATALQSARSDFGARITALGAAGYRQSYDAVLLLHLLHEIETVHGLATDVAQSITVARDDRAGQMLKSLVSRLDSTLPAFRTRETVLSMRRTAFTLTWVKLLDSCHLSR
jgi:serine/threonine-protein kinase ATR